MELQVKELNYTITKRIDSTGGYTVEATGDNRHLMIIYFLELIQGETDKEIYALWDNKAGKRIK